MKFVLVKSSVKTLKTNFHCFRHTVLLSKADKFKNIQYLWAVIHGRDDRI